MSFIVQTEAVAVLAEVYTMFELTHWTQGDWTAFSDINEKQVYCSLGAVRAVFGQDDIEETVCNADGDPDPEYTLAVAALVRAIDASGWQWPGEIARPNDDEDVVVYWNDEEGRTRESVLAVFRHARTLIETKEVTL